MFEEPEIQDLGLKLPEEEWDSVWHWVKAERYTGILIGASAATAVFTALVNRPRWYVAVALGLLALSVYIQLRVMMSRKELWRVSALHLYWMGATHATEGLRRRVERSYE